MKIMLADDEQGIRILVEHIVTEAGYDFCCATDGVQALALVEEENPDLLILDIMMPKKNGFDVCTALRERDSRIPIIFLTAKGDIVDKSIGFKSGADDYLVKPFTPEELSLRIDALLRRAHQPDKAVAFADVVRYGDIEIDAKRHRVVARGRQVDLTPKEFHLLSLLASSPGEVFTRDQIIENVWGPEYVGESSSITVFIRRIRAKIEDDPSNPQYLQTVWHVGYRFGD